MSGKYGAGNSTYGLCGDSSGSDIIEEPKFRIEVAPEKTTQVGYNHIKTPTSMNEIYTQILPDLETILDGKVNLSVNRKTGSNNGDTNGHEWVAIVAPTGKTPNTRGYLEAAVEELKTKHPNWIYIKVVEKVAK